MIEMSSAYDPKTYETKWYKAWSDAQVFHAPIDRSKEPYVILMPPPNVTAQLHMGHGTGYSIQDLLIRLYRMKGKNACWLPGTDHAGIATQMMVEADLLRTENKRPVDIGREQFLQKLWAWREKYGGIILDQFRKMGFSCDWKRVAFTMDPQLSHAVRYVFVKLFEEGLIYRGERLVNWDTVLNTAVSDDEVENKELNGHLYYFRYPVEGTSEFIPFATTRPETMLGDTAIAVNPDDERFQKLVGKKARLPFSNRLIPIVADAYVKSEFGTGAVKVTPAHDPNDFEIGKRHALPMINIMNPNGTMNDQCPDPFRGLDRFEARKLIVKEMKRLELFDKDESYKHSVPHSERSKSIIEPRLSLQWFVKMKELADPAAQAARDGRVRFYPESWKKTYLYWLDNVQDWCISRQLWWGHRIPIWYCNDCGHATTGMTDPTACNKCKSSSLRQDEDVLDTWFSSWLWPLSPFGWPDQGLEKEQGLDYFYPSKVLVTAPEIIFLWVARMIMAGLKFKGEVPFTDIYFNATVCDKQGRKFSKTLGNGIDPIEVVEKYGADAVRFTAVSMAPLGGRLRMDKSDFELGARFVNKMWNASRFLLRFIEPGQTLQNLRSLQLTLPDRWLLQRLNDTIHAFDTKMAAYRLNDAVDDLYHFVWDHFCDWSIETAKDSLNSKDAKERDRSISVLVYTLDQILRLCHPITPFVTEEIWQKLPAHPDLKREKFLASSVFPVPIKLGGLEESARQWSSVQDLISGIRSVRMQSGIGPQERIGARVRCEDALVKLFLENSATIERLAGLKMFEASVELEKVKGCLVAVGKGFEAFLPVAELLDVPKERQRLEAELKRVGRIVEGLHTKLSNKDFVDRAPEDVIEQTKKQRDNMTAQMKSLRENLNSLMD